VPKGIRLGDYRRLTGQRRVLQPVPAASVTAGGVEFDVVWNGHRDGPTLLEYSDDDGLQDHAMERGHIAFPRTTKGMALRERTPLWRWTE
jgi:hypothetical protein